MPPGSHFLIPVALVVQLASPAPAPVDARSALQHAAALAQQGRLDEADQQARLALTDPDTQAAACSVLGAIRFRQQRLDESVAFLQKAVRLEPRLVGAHLTLAQVYTVQGRTPQALAMYRQALALDPSNVLARLALAHDATANGNYQQSWDLAQPVAAQLKTSPDGLSVLSADALKLGNHAAVSEMARDWNRLADVTQAASISYALLLLGGGAVADGIGVLEHARDTTPPSFELAFNLGSAYLLAGHPDQALDAYDQALTIKPDAVAALQQAAGVAEHQNSLERSLSYWLRLKKIQPEDPATLLGFGRVCLKMDLLDDAESALSKAAASRPDDIAYQYTLAAANVGKRQFEAAQTLLEHLITQHPHDAQLEYALGSVLYLQGRLSDAAGHLRESLKVQPEQLGSRYYLALVARDLGNDADAIQMLQALVIRYPNHAPSSEALGGLLMNGQRYSEAETEMRKAVRLDPTSVKANYQLGLLLARMGRKDAADQQLAVAKSLRQEDETSSRLQLRLLEDTP